MANEIQQEIKGANGSEIFLHFLGAPLNMKIVLLKATSKSNFPVEFSVDQSPKWGWSEKKEVKRNPLILK